LVDCAEIMFFEKKKNGGRGGGGFGRPNLNIPEF
jgi:hypothetical protein